MQKPPQSEISTLSALNALQKFGVKERAIELLATISADWVQGVGVAAAEFRRDHRRDADLLRWLENRRFITSNVATPYLPEFSAFCAILVARKRIAVSLFGEMKLVVGANGILTVRADPILIGGL